MEECQNLPEEYAKKGKKVQKNRWTKSENNGGWKRSSCWDAA
jgi:hypothetical protein